MLRFPVCSINLMSVNKDIMIMLTENLLNKKLENRNSVKK